MKPRPRHARVLLCGAVASLVATSPAWATTLVPMGARALVASSVGAVRGRVTQIETGADPVSGAIYTYVTIAPTERVFGDLPDGPLVLRELGGRSAGRAQWLFGSPEYRLGESVLVFLSRHRDGALRTTGLALGKYRLDDRGRAVRRFGANVAVFDRRTGLVRDHPADEVVKLPTLLAGVRAALQEGARPATTTAPVVGRPAEYERIALEPRAAFVLFNPLVRWFEPDDGQPIGYLIDATGDATLGPDVSRQAVHEGMAVWSAVPNASIELQDVGDSVPAPFAGCPDENRIVFNDPFGELDPPKECEGVLGIGGVCDADETRVVNGKTFRRIISGKVTFNDGWGDCPMWTACNFAEIATHELGHSVGIGHSTVMSATMATRAHFDGRCAGLTDDDRAALAFMYPLPPTPSATPTVTGVPTPTPTPPPTATVTSTGTVTRTPSITQTPTRTLSPSRTRVPTRTRTPTVTTTPTRTLTPTRTPSVTRTPVATATFSPSATPTVSRTRTASATATASRSATPSASPRPSATATASASPTNTTNPSVTPTPSPVPRPGDWLDALISALRRLLSTLGSQVLAR